MVHFVPLGQLNQISCFASDLNAVRPLELVRAFVFQNEVFGVQLAERLEQFIRQENKSLTIRIIQRFRKHVRRQRYGRLRG